MDRYFRQSFDNVILPWGPGGTDQGRSRYDVLLVDDWGLAPVRDQERRDLLEILEDRYGTRSTIITRQLPPAQWRHHLADAPLADAISDRLLHNAHRIVLQGPSRRKEAKLDHYNFIAPRRSAPITMRRSERSPSNDLSVHDDRNAHPA